MTHSCVPSPSSPTQSFSLAWYVSIPATLLRCCEEADGMPLAPIDMRCPEDMWTASAAWRRMAAFAATAASGATVGGILDDRGLDEEKCVSIHDWTWASRSLSELFGPFGGSAR